MKRTKRRPKWIRRIPLVVSLFPVVLAGMGTVIAAACRAYGAMVEESLHDEENLGAPTSTTTAVHAPEQDAPRSDEVPS